MNLVHYNVSVYQCVKHHRFLVLGPHAFGEVRFHGRRILQHDGSEWLSPMDVRCRCGCHTLRRVKSARTNVLEAAWALGGLAAVRGVTGPWLATPIRYPLNVKVSGVPVIQRSTWPPDTFV